MLKMYLHKFINYLVVLNYDGSKVVSTSRVYVKVNEIYIGLYTKKAYILLKKIYSFTQ